MSPNLEDLLARYRNDLLGFVGKHAGRLTHHESVEDLVQGIHLKALEGGAGFEYRGEKPFLQWMYSVARHHLAHRYAYWSALRRRPSALVRLTRAGGETFAGDATPEPPSTDTGPMTFAERRDLLLKAVQALEVLLERDRQLVVWSSEGVGIDEMADRLQISYAAAEKARLRALERFRKAYRLATQ